MVIDFVVAYVVGVLYALVSLVLRKSHLIESISEFIGVDETGPILIDSFKLFSQMINLF